MESRRARLAVGRFPKGLLPLLFCMSACGLRTELLVSLPDAGRAPDGPILSTADGPPMVPPDLRADPSPDISAPDRPADLVSERTPDLVYPDLPSLPSLPDVPVPTEVRPGDVVIRIPDLAAERLPDLLPAERGPDGLADLASDQRVDLLPDVLSDLRPDLGPDLRPDLLPDLSVERPWEVLPDLVPDLAPPLDGPCSQDATVVCTCDNGLSGQRICLPSHVYSECGCGTPALMRVKNGVIGTWTGTANTPWVAPYLVTFTFDSYTHYGARTLQGNQVALYYGMDDDSPFKHYEITDMSANGDATGTIDIVFSSSGNFNRDDLQGIKLSTDGARLQFYFMHGGAGPLQYDLQRSTP